MKQKITPALSCNNFHWLRAAVLLALIVYLGPGCLNESSKELPTPEEKLNSILDVADFTSKTFSQTGLFVKMANDSASIQKVIYDAASLRISSIEQAVLTEKCLEVKRQIIAVNVDSIHQYKYDSAYLSLIVAKFRDIDKNLRANGDPTFFDLWVRNEKFRALLNQLNQICPEVGSDATNSQ